MTGLRTRAAAALAALTASLTLLALPAVADSGFVEQITAATADPMRLAPGTSTTREVLVRNDSPDAALLNLRVSDVVEDDNGCVLPESRDGDVSCGDTGGELGDWLEVDVRLLTSRTSNEQLWWGTLRDLEAGVDLVADMPPGAEWRLAVVSHLPRAAGNDTMTDRIGYDLRWTMSAERGPDEVDILGVEQSAGGATSSGGGATSGGVAAVVAGVYAQLPDTGGPVGVLMLVVMTGLLTAGAVLMVIGRPRPGPAGAAARNRRG